MGMGGGGGGGGIGDIQRQQGDMKAASNRKVTVDGKVAVKPLMILLRAPDQVHALSTALSTVQCPSLPLLSLSL